MRIRNTLYSSLYQKVKHYGRHQSRASKGKRKYLERWPSHPHSMLSAPTKLVVFMTKRHLNSDSTAHNSLYHLKKGPNGTSIQVIPLRRTGGRLRYNNKKIKKKRLYKERNPSRKGDEHFKNLKKKKRTKDLIVMKSALTIYEQSFLGRALGSVYAEFVLHPFLLIVLFFLASSLDLTYHCY